MDYSFFGRLLLVKNQTLRNVTGATLNKYTESQRKQKLFIREKYMTMSQDILSEAIPVRIG
jgi:hypothetical protein